MVSGCQCIWWLSCLLFLFSVNSSALKMARYSAWLLVHLLFNLYFRLFMRWPDLNMTIPAPTPCSDLLPSVNIRIVLVSSLSSVTKVIVSAG